MIHIHKPRFKFYLNKEFFSFSFAIKKPQFCFGIQNRINENEYVPFFDFDNTDLYCVKKFSEWLYYFNDGKYGYTILQTSDNGFHVIYWKITLRDYYLHYLIDAIPYGLDIGYIQVFLSRGFSVLRISSKLNKPIPYVLEYKKGSKCSDEEIMRKLFQVNKNLMLYTTFKY